VAAGFGSRSLLLKTTNPNWIGELQDAGTVSLDIPSIGARPQNTPRTTPPSDHRPVLAHFDL